MQKKVFLIILIIVYPMFLFSQLIYEYPMVRQHSGGIFIAKVTLSDTSTVIDAFAINDAYRPSALISTAPPGNNNAFRLIANQTFYQIKKAEGIPYTPDDLTLAYGDTVFFSMYFDPIPLTTTSIDLVEGASQVTNAWMIYGIQLAPTWINNDQRTMFKEEQGFTTYFAKNRQKLWEIEGFWQIEANCINKKETQQKAFYDFKKIAIVRENNIFSIYNMKGEKLDISFRHFKRNKYTFKFSIKNYYPILKTFKFKNDFNLKFRLTTNRAKALGLGNEFTKTKVYFSSNWKFIGRGDLVDN